MLNEQALKESIRESSDWEHAVDDFIDCSTQLGQPFTSGHITTILRVYRPEFRFSHRQVGERCQDLFHSGAIQFQSQLAIQVPRVCAGLGRTPSGTTVFTYAAEQDQAESFPFELDIPKPGAGLTQMPQEYPIQTQTPGRVLRPNLPNALDMRAKVHSDKHLCVPRAAFEALLHASARALRGGEPAWVSYDTAENKAHITLDQHPGAVSYDISKDRGRVLFPKPGSGQFEHGDLYQCTIEGDGVSNPFSIVVDLSTSL